MRIPPLNPLLNRAFDPQRSPSMHPLNNQKRNPVGRPLFSPALHRRLSPADSRATSPVESPLDSPLTVPREGQRAVHRFNRLLVQPRHLRRSHCQSPPLILPVIPHLHLPHSRQVDRPLNRPVCPRLSHSLRPAFSPQLYQPISRFCVHARNPLRIQAISQRDSRRPYPQISLQLNRAFSPVVIPAASRHAHHP